jgi:N-acetylglucosamine kinase-like BadF-type ATPase
MRIILGVDAGGSQTTAAVADGNGTVLVRSVGGPGAMRPGGAEAAAAAIHSTCRDALTKAERAVKGDVLAVGAAGVGREEERLALSAALEATGLAPRVMVTTDAAIALAAAFGEGPGIVLIAGTGSIAWARLPDGSTARVGGLGPVLGDQGSGYDLGRGALRAVGLALEGRGRPTALTSRILRRLHLAGLSDLVRWTAEAERSAVSALAPDILDAAAAGDAVAGALVDAGADDLGSHVRVLALRFPPGQRVRIAFGGGVLSRSQEYRKRVAARILAEVEPAELAPEPVDPVLGAVQLARAL